MTTATMTYMGKSNKADAPKAVPPVLYLRLTPTDEAMLQAYIAAQDTPPDRTAVGLRALREFMAKRNIVAPPPPRK